MNKIGFSTSKGFHDDVERVREDMEQVSNDAKILCVDYELTDLKFYEPVELDLPEGRTFDDIIGIEFLGRSNWLTYFGRGRELGTGAHNMTCVGFISGGTGGLYVEYAYIQVKQVGEKFTFEISRLANCNTASNTGETLYTEGDYVFGEAGVTKTIHIHFK